MLDVLITNVPGRKVELGIRQEVIILFWPIATLGALYLLFYFILITTL